MPQTLKKRGASTVVVTNRAQPTNLCCDTNEVDGAMAVINLVNAAAM